MGNDIDEARKEKLWYMKIERIKKEIKQLKTLKTELKNKETEYKTFKTEITGVANDANSVNGNVISAQSEFNKNIKTSRNKIDTNSFSQASKYLVGISNGINRLIIPAIDKKLKELKKKITDTEGKIREKQRELRSVSQKIS